MKTLREFTGWLEEETKPEFDFDHFSKLERPKALRYLVQTNLKKINSGATRSVFRLDSAKVIKIATMEAGVFHNQQEFLSSTCLSSKYSVVVIERHPEFWWLIEEYLEPFFSEDRFEDVFFKHLGIHESWYQGLNGDDIVGAIKLGVWGSKHELPKRQEANEDWFTNSSWYAGLINAIKTCDVDPVDFYSENWGVRPSTGELVLLDLGF